MTSGMDPVLGRRVMARDGSDNGMVNSPSADGFDPVIPTQPASLSQIDSNPVRRLVRLNSNPSPTLPVLSSDNRSSWGDRFGGGTSSSDSITTRNPNLPTSPPRSEGPLGLVSGKPMRFIPLPIFNARDNSNAAGDQNWFTMLGGLSREGGKPQTSAIDVSAQVAPFVSNRQNTFGSGSGASSPADGSVDAFIPAASVAQQPQKSAASLIMDYIQHLKQLDANPSPASVFDTGASAVPFASLDDITGGRSGAPSPVPQPPKDQRPLSLMDAYLLYQKRLDANQSQASVMDASAPATLLAPSDASNFSGGLLGRMAALMGVDQQNPDQLAPLSQDDELRAFYRDNPAQPWTLQRWR